MDWDFLFVEMCALVCAVALAFRVGRVVRRHMGKELGGKAASGPWADWYCFFRPSDFHRHKSAKQFAAARRDAEKAATKSAARPRMRAAGR